MVTAVIIAVIFMMAFSRSISDFVDRHPTIRMLALSFLILIGVSLVGEGLGFHIPKGYIYFAMAFSVGVEMLNRARGKSPVQLRDTGEMKQEGRLLRANYGEILRVSKPASAHRRGSVRESTIVADDGPDDLSTRATALRKMKCPSS
jgi:hypothetical protein